MIEFLKNYLIKELTGIPPNGFKIFSIILGNTSTFSIFLIFPERKIEFYCWLYNNLIEFDILHGSNIRYILLVPIQILFSLSSSLCPSFSLSIYLFSLSLRDRADTIITLPPATRNFLRTLEFTYTHLISALKT